MGQPPSTYQVSSRSGPGPGRCRNSIIHPNDLCPSDPSGQFLGQQTSTYQGSSRSDQGPGRYRNSTFDPIDLDLCPSSGQPTCTYQVSSRSDKRPGRYRNSVFGPNDLDLCLSDPLGGNSWVNQHPPIKIRRLTPVTLTFARVTPRGQFWGQPTSTHQVSSRSD